MRARFLCAAANLNNDSVLWQVATCPALAPRADALGHPTGMVAPVCAPWPLWLVAARSHVA